jgi:hypothetical protein
MGDQAGDLAWLANASEGNRGFHHLQVIDRHARRQGVRMIAIADLPRKRQNASRGNCTDGIRPNATLVTTLCLRRSIPSMRDSHKKLPTFLLRKSPKKSNDSMIF